MQLNISKSIYAIGSSIIVTLAAFVGTSLYTDYIKQPNIHIDLTPVTNSTPIAKSNYSTAVELINITNIGMVSAQNLRLALSSTNAIMSKPNILSNTENITKPINDKGAWVIQIPRLVPRESAFLKAALNFTNITAFKIVKAYAAYNNLGHFASFNLSYTGMDCNSKAQKCLVNFDNPSPLDVWTSLPFILGIIAFLSGASLFSWYVINKRTVVRRNQLKKKICEDACQVINWLNGEQRYILLSDKLYSLYLWKNQTVDARHSYFKKKFGNVDEFFQKIIIHDEMIKDGKHFSNNNLVGMINEEVKKEAKKLVVEYGCYCKK
jgi:hypothetical protein